MLRVRKQCCVSLMLVLALLCGGRLWAQGTAGGGATAPLTVAVAGKPLVELGGRWQFHLGDDPRWAAPGFDDAGWATVTTDKGWDVQGYPDHGGFAWYRRHLRVEAAGATVALYPPQILGPAEVYWNGKKVGGCGRLPPHGVIIWCNQAITLPVAATGVEGVLALRVWSIPGYGLLPPGEEGISATPQLGSKATVDANFDQALYQYWRGERAESVLGVLYVVACLLACLVWALDRREPMSYWLVIFLSTVALRLWLTPWSEMGGLPWVLKEDLISIAEGVGFAALWLLLLRMFGLDQSRRWRRVTWAAIGLMMLLSLVSIGVDHALFQWTAKTALVYRIFWWAETLTELGTLVLIVSGIRRRSNAADWAVGLTASVAVLIPVVYNIFQLFERWDIADEFIPKPIFTVFGGDVSSVEMSRLLLLLALGYAAVRRLREARRQHLETELEVRSAHEVQQILVPETLPAIEGYALTSAYYPAREVGGDFFQVISLEDASTLVLIGDVSGKGLRAGMMVALITGAVRTPAEVDPEPAALLASLNRRLCGRMQGGFVTCLALRMFPDGRCTVANAGHLPPVVEGWEVEMPGALPLGLDPEAEYLPARLRLRGGDTMTLFTDGVPEARNAHGELFGFERTVAATAGRPGAEGIARQARTFGQEDDITVLTVERVAGESVVPVALRSQVVTAG